MKAFKTFESAYKAAGPDKLVLKAANFFIAIEESDRFSPEATGLLELAVIRDKKYTGHVTVHHLERLGCANWATPNTHREIPAAK